MNRNEINRLKTALRPLRIKMSLETAFAYLLCGGAAGISLGTGVIVYSKFVFLPERLSVFAGVSLCASLLAVCYAVFRKLPDWYAVAAAADALGYQQRFITAFEEYTAVSLSSFAPLVISDAVNHAENADFRKQYKIKAPKRFLAFFLLASAMALIATIIPAPAAENLRHRAELRETNAIEAEKIIGLAETEAAKLTDKDARELMSRVDELLKELKNAKSEAESIRAVRKTQEELKKLSNNSVSRELKEIGEKLAANENTRALGESIQRADTEAIKQNMESLAEFLREGTGEELKALAESIRELSESLTDNPELAEMLEAIAEAAEKGALGDLNESLSALERSIAEAAARNKDFRDAVERLNDSLSQSAGRISSGGAESSDADTNNQNQNKQGQEGEAQGSQGQDPQGFGGEESQSSQGQGAQSGQGQGSGGAALGSDGSGWGSGHKENESIYSRDALAMRDAELNIQGDLTEQGNTNTGITSGKGEEGGSVPYNEVFRKYRDEALRSLEDTEIPFGLREIVKDYFSSLE